MTRRIPSWQKVRKPGHARRREAKRPVVRAPRAPRLRLMLWSVNGEPVTAFEVMQNGHPSHVDWGGIRYDLVSPPGNGVAHYQTHTIVHKSAQAVA